MMADWEQATSKDGGFAEEKERVRREALRGDFERQQQIGRAVHSQAGMMYATHGWKGLMPPI